MRVSPFVVVLVIILICPLVLAQSPSDQTIDRLKDEIVRREAIERDESMPSNLKETNRRILEQRRSELLLAVRSRIAAVQKYIETLGSAAVEEEKRSASESLRVLSLTVDGVVGNGGVGGSVAPNPSKSDVSTLPRLPTDESRPQGSGSDQSRAVVQSSDLPFKISSPLTDSSTPLQEITVTVALNPEKALGFDVDFDLIVKNKDEKPTEQKKIRIKASELKSPAVPIKLSEGANTIEVIQGGRKAVAKVVSTPVARAIDETTSKIKLERPKKCISGECPSFNSSTVQADLSVSDTQIQKIGYEVRNGEKLFSGPVKNLEGKTVTTIDVRVAVGENTIRFFDVDDSANEEKQVLTKVICSGASCASDFLVSTVPSSSENTRVVVGMEQVGASTASSKINPFVDFFFTTPFAFNHLKKKVPKLNGGKPVLNNGKPVFETERVLDGDGNPVRVPRFGAWGQIRLSTTPEQTANAAVFPSNLVNQLTGSASVVELVQSFDFLAGVEARIFSANGWTWTLIPGVKQRTRFYLTFGAGAISPLNADRESAQIFRIPDAGDDDTPPSSQRDLFVQRFGEPPEGKTFIGFVPLERDRFFRQYYFGIRLKTHYCNDADCWIPIKRFPSIVDFSVGQNEAVTGGRLFHDVRDANNTIVGKKRSWVLRIDGFYPLPIKEASFLYLYGTAVMKIGAGGVRIDNPLFLDTAPGEVLITSPLVFIPPPEKQPSQLDRDYYKIGIGINLTDLLNRNKVNSP
jgi:hypothetical protein